MLWADTNIWLYICVKIFPKMKYVKSHYRSALTDEHLQSILMTGNSNSEPQLSKMYHLKKKSIFLISVPVLQKVVLSNKNNYYYYYHIWISSIINLWKCVFFLVIKYLQKSLNFDFWTAKSKIYTLWPFTEIV